MLLYGSWVTIPSDKLEYRLLDGDVGETSGGHWCGDYNRGSGWTFIKTHCVRAAELYVIPFYPIGIVVGASGFLRAEHNGGDEQ